MEEPYRYYFDADVLILLDKCGLAGKLEYFKRRTGAELIITPTIKNELGGARRKQPATRHDVPALIQDAIDANVITVIGNESGGKMHYKKAKYLGVGKGEASLLALVESYGGHQTKKSILVTNDAKAYKKAKEVNVKGCNIGELMQYLCRNG